MKYPAKRRIWFNNQRFDTLDIESMPQVIPNIADDNLLKNFTILALSANVYIEIITVTNTSKSPVATFITPFIYCVIYSGVTYFPKSIDDILFISSFAFNFTNTESSGNSFIVFVKFV